MKNFIVQVNYIASTYYVVSEPGLESLVERKESATQFVTKAAANMVAESMRKRYGYNCEVKEL